MIYSDTAIEAENQEGNLNSSSGPLLSWDIFMNSYWRKMRLLDDSQDIYNLSKEYSWNHNWDFRKEILLNNKIIIVTNPKLHIVSVSSNITDMNGYGVEEIVGNTPNMFQGEGTQEESKKIIREAIWELRPFETYIRNFRKNGHPYDCHIKGYPVFNFQQQLSHFIAFEEAA